MTVAELANQPLHPVNGYSVAIKENVQRGLQEIETLGDCHADDMADSTDVIALHFLVHSGVHTLLGVRLDSRVVPLALDNLHPDWTDVASRLLLVTLLDCPNVVDDRPPDRKGAGRRLRRQQPPLRRQRGSARAHVCECLGETRGRAKPHGHSSVHWCEGPLLGERWMRQPTAPLLPDPQLVEVMARVALRHAKHLLGSRLQGSHAGDVGEDWSGQLRLIKNLVDGKV